MSASVIARLALLASEAVAGAAALPESCEAEQPAVIVDRTSAKEVRMGALLAMLVVPFQSLRSGKR